MQKVVEAIISFIIGAHGIILNSTILSVYFRKSTSLGITDKILFSMVLTSLLLQCSMIFIIYTVFLQTQDAKNAVVLLYVALCALFVMIHMNLWNTAWLSMCYCVKLVNISHQTFLQVKTRFSSSIRKLLLGSAVCSSIVCLPLLWTSTFTLLYTNISSDPLRFKLQLNVYYGALNILVNYVLPFALTLLCFGLSVMSLLHHVWRIRQNVSQSNSPPQLRALVRAVVTITLRIMLDLIFMAIYFYIFAISFYLEPLLEVIFCFSLMLYPSMQSFVLIFGNPKLKSKLLGWQSRSDVISNYKK